MYRVCVCSECFLHVKGVLAWTTGAIVMRTCTRTGVCIRTPLTNRSNTRDHRAISIKHRTITQHMYTLTHTHTNNDELMMRDDGGIERARQMRSTLYERHHRIDDAHTFADTHTLLARNRSLTSRSGKCCCAALRSVAHRTDANTHSHTNEEARHVLRYQRRAISSHTHARQHLSLGAHTRLFPTMHMYRYINGRQTHDVERFNPTRTRSNATRGCSGGGSALSSLYTLRLHTHSRIANN